LFEPGQGGLLLARATTGIALAGVYPPAPNQIIRPAEEHPLPWR
jgi:hypothetical protein